MTAEMESNLLFHFKSDQSKEAGGSNMLKALQIRHFHMSVVSVGFWLPEFLISP